MKTPEELLREFAENPAGLAECAARLQERLAFQAQQLAEAEREKELKEQQLAEAQAIIAELKRELFGAKADKLNPEQLLLPLGAFIRFVPGFVEVHDTFDGVAFVFLVHGLISLQVRAASQQ